MAQVLQFMLQCATVSLLLNLLYTIARMCSAHGVTLAFVRMVYQRHTSYHVYEYQGNRMRARPAPTVLQCSAALCSVVQRGASRCSAVCTGRSQEAEAQEVQHLLRDLVDGRLPPIRHVLLAYHPLHLFLLHLFLLLLHRQLQSPRCRLSALPSPPPPLYRYLLLLQTARSGPYCLYHNMICVCV